MFPFACWERNTCVTYLYFHLVFILPVIGAIYALKRLGRPLQLRGKHLGIATLALIALVYTTPWDNYLVASGVWTYGEGRVIESWVIGYVPFEEYLFFVLQPLLTGMFLQWFLAANPHFLAEFREPLRRGRPAGIGMSIALSFGVLGVFALLHPDSRFTYLGLILVWACPVIAFQWIYGGGVLWRMRRCLFPAVMLPTAYLCLVDLIAITWRIWEIRPETSTGWLVLGLPMEEAVFFLVTNLMVVQGLLLFYQFTESRSAVAARRNPILRHSLAG